MKPLTRALTTERYKKTLCTWVVLLPRDKKSLAGKSEAKARKMNQTDAINPTACFPALHVMKLLGKRLKRAFKKSTPPPPPSVATAGSPASSFLARTGSYTILFNGQYSHHSFIPTPITSTQRDLTANCTPWRVIDTDAQPGVCQSPLPRGQEDTKTNARIATGQAEQPRTPRAAPSELLDTNTMDIGSLAAAVGADGRKGDDIAKHDKNDSAAAVKPVAAAVPKEEEAPVQEVKKDEKPKPAEPKKEEAPKNEEPKKEEPKKEVPKKEQAKEEEKKAAPPPPPKTKPPPSPPPLKKKGAAPPPPPGGLKGPKGEKPRTPGGGGGPSGVQRQPQVIEMFQEVRRASLGQQSSKPTGRTFQGGGGGKAVDANDLIAEISKNSQYAVSIQNDITKYDQVIKDLIKEIANFKAKDMRYLLEFVNSTDSVLDRLSDETAVLKNFNWPGKYFMFREARHMHNEMDAMKKQFREWKRHPNRSNADGLRDMQKCVEKTIERIDQLMKTKDADEKKFKEAGIPWNGNIVVEVKHASLSLMDAYMKLALEEVARIESREKDPDKCREKCLNTLTGTVRFSFKVHQFAGGFSESCSTQFTEISAKTRALMKPVEKPDKPSTSDGA